MDLSNRSTGALLVGTLTIAALHALIPSHWLAFAVVGRAQCWTRRRTLATVALAGLGHIGITLLLGTLLAVVGRAFLSHLPDWLEHAAPSMLLILLGLWFAIPAWRSRNAPHHHPGLETRPADQKGRTRTATTALVLGMTLSPCLDLLPLYIAASALPRQTLIAISVVMAVTTMTLMVGLVWLTLCGLEKLHLHWLEHNEGVAVGGILIALGVLLLFL